jgi:hypothetical protein
MGGLMGGELDALEPSRQLDSLFAKLVNMLGKQLTLRGTKERVKYNEMVKRRWK